MKNLFYLGYESDAFHSVSKGLKHRLKDFELTEYTGQNVDVKEFVRIRLKGSNSEPDYFLLDVRSLQSTDYTAILLFKANIMDKYPSLKDFLVIAQQSDGLSVEEYNDIIRNSVSGKNYPVFYDSSPDRNVEAIVNYIENRQEEGEREHQDRKEKRKKRRKKEGSKDEVQKEEGEENGTETEETEITMEDIVKEPFDQEQGSKKELSAPVRTRDKISDNESVKSMKRKLYAGDLWEKEKDVSCLSDLRGVKTAVYKEEEGYKKKNWDCEDELAIVFGTKPGLGTSFISMSLALFMAESGARTSYVQLAKRPHLDESAKDYGMKKTETYYKYKKAFFTQNEFLEKMNYHIADLGSNFTLLKKALDLGWLTDNRLYLVAGGNTSGIKALDNCIFKLNELAGGYNIIIVNPILSDSVYEAYAEDTQVYYFEYVKEPSDKVNSYNLGLIANELYRIGVKNNKRTKQPL